MEVKAKAAENDVRNATTSEKKAKAELAEMENRCRMTLKDSETKPALHLYPDFVSTLALPDAATPSMRS